MYSMPTPYDETTYLSHVTDHTWSRTPPVIIVQYFKLHTATPHKYI